MTSHSRVTSYAAGYLLEVAANLDDGEPMTVQQVRDLLAGLADDLCPPHTADVEQWKCQPVPEDRLARALHRHLVQSEEVQSDYGRCVLLAQLLGSAANRLDVAGWHGRADVVRRFASAVSAAGNAL